MSYAMSVVDMSLPLLDDGQEMLKIGRRTPPSGQETRAVTASFLGSLTLKYVFKFNVSLGDARLDQIAASKPDGRQAPPSES